MEAGTATSWDMHVEIRGQFVESVLSFYLTWIPGIKMRSLGMCVKHLYLLNLFFKE